MIANKISKLVNLVSFCKQQQLLYSVQCTKVLSSDNVVLHFDISSNYLERWCQDQLSLLLFEEKSLQVHFGRWKRGIVEVIANV